MQFYVIQYAGERVPVVPQQGHDERPIPLISTDGRDWRIDETGALEVDGRRLAPAEVTMGRPGPQDDLLMQSLHEFDPEEYPPLSYPVPELI